jgi:hypothetical protein
MWRTITSTDMLGVLNATEAAAYQVAAIGTLQDPLADATEAVVNQCRGYIADNPANQLADGLTLPERCHLPAMHMIRVEVLARLDMPVSEDRAKAKADAIRFFERVADGKVAVEQPTGTLSSETPAAPSCETLSSRDRIATREKMAGL